MDVKVVDYDSSENENYVVYKISNLPLNQLEYLNNNLEDYIARDEIEMNVFLSSYLENFKPI